MLQLLTPEGILTDRDAVVALGLSSKDIIEVYKRMLYVRAISERGEKEGHTERMALFIGPRGQEAAEVASVYALPPEVTLFLYGRSWGAAITRGVKPQSVFGTYYGTMNPKTKQDFLSHRVEPLYTVVGTNTVHAVGAAWAPKLLEKRNAPAAAYFGDGAMSEGYLHTAMNWSQIYGIPLILFCENNQWAISTPVSLNSPTPTFTERARGYGMATELVDGNDLFAVYAAARRSYNRAVSEGRPTFIELVTYRLGPHSTAVGALCKILEGEMVLAQKNEPVVRTHAFLFSNYARELFGIEWDEEKDAALRESIAKETKAAAEKSYKEIVEEKNAVAEAKKARTTTLTQNLAAATLSSRKGKRYTEVSTIKCIPRKIQNVAIRDAVGVALLDIMRHDPTVFYLGQDVGRAGGVMRTTAIREDIASGEKYIATCLTPELLKEKIIRKYLPLQTIFPERIIDSPLDENGIIGVGVGLALGDGTTRIRPVLEIQFSGFVRIAMDQIEEASRIWHRSGGLVNVPLTVLLPFGAGERVEYHRECEIPLFTNNPGLVVVCPATPQDAYDMMWASVASEKVVLFFTHIDLYREPKTELLRLPHTRPIESFDIRVAREGKHVTVISCGKLVHDCLAVADELAGEGISAEVLDLRVLSPLQPEKLLASVKKTGRLVTIQEEPLFYGTGAELVASVTGDHETFLKLQAPTQRVGAPWSHMPPQKFCSDYVPQREDIRQAIIETVKF